MRIILENMPDIYGRILHFPSISDEYLRNIGDRSLIVSLKIDTILVEVRFHRRGKKHQ